MSSSARGPDAAAAPHLYIDKLSPDNREAFTEEVKTEMRRHKAMRSTAFCALDKEA
jgi:hypothetical protein